MQPGLAGRREVLTWASCRCCWLGLAPLWAIDDLLLVWVGPVLGT
jgi:hypothetical protein